MKPYYFFVDILKFICCLGIMMIHAKPFEYMPDVYSHVSQLYSAFVSIFFVLSSILFGAKLQYNKSDNDYIIRYCKRLLILYFSWTLLLIPLWVPSLMGHYPREWVWLVFPKIFICGAPLGSWFVVALIYGTIIVYYSTKYLGKYISFVIFLIVDAYYIGVREEVFSDFLNIYIKYKIFDSFFLPNRAFLWICIGLIIGSNIDMIKKIVSRHKLVFVMSAFIFIILSLLSSSKIYLIYDMLLTITICLLAFGFTISNQKRSEITIYMRKMSILIYFLHFVFVIFYRQISLYLHTYEYGMREYAIVLVLSLYSSYYIVKFSKRYTRLKYLY